MLPLFSREEQEEEPPGLFLPPPPLARFFRRPPLGGKALSQRRHPSRKLTLGYLTYKPF